MEGRKCVCMQKNFIAPSVGGTRDNEFDAVDFFLKIAATFWRFSRLPVEI